MNEIVNKCLVAGDKVIPEIHLKQSGFTYSACGPFTKNKERIKKSMRTGNTEMNLIKLDKTFQHDMAYCKSKDLTKELNQTKFLEIKYLKLQVIQNMMVIKENSLRSFTSFLIRSLVEVVLVLNQIINLQMHFTSRSLTNSREEKFIHLLEELGC